MDRPAVELEFLESYARRHGLTVAEVVGRYLHRLKSDAQPSIHPEVTALTGLVPPDLDPATEYHRHLLDKHR